MFPTLNLCKLLPPWKFSSMLKKLLTAGLACLNTPAVPKGKNLSPSIKKQKIARAKARPSLKPPMEVSPSVIRNAREITLPDGPSIYFLLRALKGKASTGLPEIGNLWSL